MISVIQQYIISTSLLLVLDQVVWLYAGEKGIVSTGFFMQRLLEQGKYTEQFCSEAGIHDVYLTGELAHTAVIRHKQKTAPEGAVID